MRVPKGQTSLYRLFNGSFALALFFFAAISTALFLSATTARAQQDDEDVVRVNSDLVVLNVTVTDREGAYVHKLTRPDFKIFEDGREQQPFL